MSKASLLNTGNAFPCAIRAWSQHEDALAQWLLRQTGSNRALCEDILQEVFIRLMQQQKGFCDVKNTKGWLITVARNLLVDYQRRDRLQPMDELPDVPVEAIESASVDLLANACFPRVLSELAAEDQDIIKQCDINGMKQQSYADENGLSLPATKARLRRARLKLKQRLETACQVQFDENEQVCCFTPRSE